MFASAPVEGTCGSGPGVGGMRRPPRDGCPPIPCGDSGAGVTHPELLEVESGSPKPAGLAAASQSPFSDRLGTATPPLSSPLMAAHPIDDLLRKHKRKAGHRYRSARGSSKTQPGLAGGPVPGGPSSGGTPRRLLGLRVRRPRGDDNWHQRLESFSGSPSSVDDDSPTEIQHGEVEWRTSSMGADISPPDEFPRRDKTDLFAASHYFNTSPPLTTRSLCPPLWSQNSRSNNLTTDREIDLGNISSSTSAVIQTARSMSPQSARPSFHDPRFQRLTRHSISAGNSWIQRASHLLRHRISSWSLCLALHSCNCASPCFPLSYYLNAKELDEYRKLYRKATTPVDRNSKRHQHLLQEYWTKIYPDIEVPEVPHRLWQAAGFQSYDPWTDFRGGGAMALELMVAFARRHTPTLRNISRDCVSRMNLDHPEVEQRSLTWSNLYYPYSASFINVEFFLLSFLRLNSELARLFKEQPRHRSRSTSVDSLFLDDSLELSEASPFRKGPKQATKSFGKLLAMRSEADGRTAWSASSDGSEKNNSDRGELITINPVFVELFCATCLRVHKEWAKIADVTNLLAFGEVWDKVWDALEEALSTLSSSFDTYAHTAMDRCYRSLIGD